MVKLWQCWIFFVLLFLNAVVLGENLEAETDSDNAEYADLQQFHEVDRPVENDLQFDTIWRVDETDDGKNVVSKNDGFEEIHLNEKIEPHMNSQTQEKPEVDKSDNRETFVAEFLTFPEPQPTDDNNFTDTTEETNGIKDVEKTSIQNFEKKEFSVNGFWDQVFSGFNGSINATESSDIKKSQTFEEYFDKNDTVAVGDNDFDGIELNGTTFINVTQNMDKNNVIPTVENELIQDIDELDHDYDYNGIMQNKMFSEKFYDNLKNSFLPPKSDKNDTEIQVTEKLENGTENDTVAVGDDGDMNNKSNDEKMFDFTNEVVGIEFDEFTSVATFKENDVGEDAHDYDYNGIIPNKKFFDKNYKKSVKQNILSRSENNDTDKSENVTKNDDVAAGNANITKNETLKSDASVKNVVLVEISTKVETNETIFLQSTEMIEDDVIDGSGSGEPVPSTMTDDEAGDDVDEDSESDITQISQESTFEPKFIFQQKCHCSEVKECLSEVWSNYNEESDENLLTKCSLTFLKDDCLFDTKTLDTRLVQAEIIEDEATMSCTENKQTLFNKQMLKCFNSKFCFLENQESKFNKMRPFCLGQVKKLIILNGLNLSKDEILGLKGDYEKTFDEEFVDGRITNPGRNIFSRFYYNVRNKFCDTF